jgi:hypothetical protein
MWLLQLWTTLLFWLCTSFTSISTAFLAIVHVINLMWLLSVASGPFTASALSAETAGSVDGAPSTSPAQCVPSAAFHYLAADPSIQTVAAAEAHSSDAASSTACTVPAVAALSLEAAGAASAKTVPAAKAADAGSSSIPPPAEDFLSVKDVAPPFYLVRNSCL